MASEWPDEARGVGWAEAWPAAAGCLEGASRARLPGASPGVELGVLDWGPGRGGDRGLALLHHANGFCGATLAPIAVALRERGLRVVAIDARGHGASTKVEPARRGDGPDPYAWETLAEDLLAAISALLERTGHDRVALGLGHSFGGALLLRAASLRPASIERLLLCDPVILPARDPASGLESRRPNPLAEASRKRRDRFPSREAAYAHCRSRGLFADFTPEALALYVGEGMHETPDGQIALACPRDVEAAIFDGGATWGGPGTLEAIGAEVLFVHALRGNFSRTLYDEVAARIPRARVESHDVGHLFPLEQPDRVLEHVDALLPG